MTAIYTQIAKVLESRIRHGDYLLKGMPSGRALAAEMGVSHTVVRGAVKTLVAKGLLTSLPNGRYKALLAPERDSRPQPRIGFLVPEYVSPFYGLCRSAVESVAREVGAYVRVVDYIHWDDVVIDDALNSFDGVYVAPLAQDMPLACARRFAKAKCRVVMLEHDLTAYGIPCIDIFPIQGLPPLFAHLSENGRRRVGCFNVQPEDSVNKRRIGAWQTWMRERGQMGRLIDEPVPLYGRTITQARSVMDRVLQEGALDCEALFVTTGEAARGVIRALCDHGIAVGRDIFVGSVDDDGDARHLTPSLTALELPDLPRLVRQTMAWMVYPEREWVGELKLGESRHSLFIGETTHPQAVGVKNKSKFGFPNLAGKRVLVDAASSPR